MSLRQSICGSPNRAGVFSLSLRRRLSVIAIAAATAFVAAAPAITASAAGSIPSGWVGTDISWPQCGTDSPTGYSYGVIGVTGGAPFTGNPCFGAEYSYSQSTIPTQLYINLDFGQATAGPLQCPDGDRGCQAYNYGYDSAKWAFGYADYASAGSAEALPNWWLDVETESNWSENVDLNSYVIQGALDFLRGTQGKTVGIYSTSHQWRIIAGQFSPPNTPNWVAGAAGLDDSGKCSASLWPGGQVWAIQYLNWDLNLDQDIGC
jgi:hypothetical protein